VRQLGQVVGQVGGRGVAVCPVGGHGLFYDSTQLRVQARSHAGDGLRAAGEYLVKQLCYVAPLEGQSSCEQLIEDDAEGIDINAMVCVVAAGGLLGGHVGRGPRRQPEFTLARDLVLVGEVAELGNAKIENLYLDRAVIASGQEKVGRFEVIVQNPPLVSGQQALASLKDNLDRFRGVQGAPFESCFEVLSIEVFHDQIGLTFVGLAQVGNIHGMA
jgi:hypothetical protein